MRTVIGIDPSLSNTGVAVWQEGRITTFSIPTKPAMGPRVIRERVIVGAIMPWIAFSDQLRRRHDDTQRHPPQPAATLVVIEAVHQSRIQTGRTALDLAGLHDVLVYAFVARDITVGVAAPQCPKILATGRGNASKPQMVAAAETEFGIAVANPDEADAAWLMAGGVVAGGGKINGWPATTFDQVRQDSLAKVTWIGWYKPDWLAAT